MSVREKNSTIYKTVIGNTEKVLIENALEKTGGNQILAARFLGLNRNTIRSKIKKLNIDMEKFKS
jgi:two-component system, NtrC family, nitrogen regulation response regulator GlnG